LPVLLLVARQGWASADVVPVAAGAPAAVARAQLLFDDGVAYMANRAPGSVDIVIVDSTDPVGPAEGLFNKAFYESCFRALRDGGILVQQSESPLALLGLIREMRAEMAKAGFAEFALLPFPQPCYPTGWWSCTLARKPGGGGFGFREADARDKGFPTRYYSAGVHRGALETPPFVADELQLA
jgi:spermidine synthase